METTFSQIPRGVFSPLFQEYPDFERILHTANQSPYLVSMLRALHARGGEVDLSQGNAASYSLKRDTISIGLGKMPEPDEQGRISPAASRTFATLLAHEAGHATLQNRNVVANTPWQAGEIGLTGEGIAFRSEYIVARQLEHANGGEHVFLHSDSWLETSRHKLDALARQSGIDSQFAGRTKDTHGPAWDAFDKQAQQIGTEHYRYLNPSTRPGVVYDEYYSEGWALLRAGSAIQLNSIATSRITSDDLQVIRNPDDSWRLVGRGVPRKDGQVMDFDVRFNANSVIQGQPRLDLRPADHAIPMRGSYSLANQDLSMAAAEPTLSDRTREPGGMPWSQRLSATQMSHFVQASKELGPALQERGHSLDQVGRVCAAAVVHCGQHHHPAQGQSFMLSRDGLTLVVLDRGVHLSEMPIAPALRQDIDKHFEQAARQHVSAERAEPALQQSLEPGHTPARAIT